MKRPDRIDWIALALLTGTAVSVLLAERGRVAHSAALVAVVLALALGKGALVVLDYMELRHAPRRWRQLLLGWLVGVVAVIAFVTVL